MTLCLFLLLALCPAATFVGCSAIEQSAHRYLFDVVVVILFCSADHARLIFYELCSCEHLASSNPNQMNRAHLSWRSDVLAPHAVSIEPALLRCYPNVADAGQLNFNTFVYVWLRICSGLSAKCTEQFARARARAQHAHEYPAVCSSSVQSLPGQPMSCKLVSGMCAEIMLSNENENEWCLIKAPYSLLSNIAGKHCCSPLFASSHRQHVCRIEYLMIHLFRRRFAIENASNEENEIDECLEMFSFRTLVTQHICITMTTVRRT